MWEAFSHTLQDPAGAAIPFFLLFMVIEMAMVRREEREDRPRTGMGYLAVDTRASLTMFAISLVFSAVFRTAAFLLYTVIYVHLAPWHLSASSPWTWIGVLIGVDLLWYLYHRFAHRVRLGWAGHQAHHSSIYFNFSAALRQKWNQWFEVLIWLPLPLLGVPPWMIYFVFSINLIWQFHLHTERIGRFPRWWEYVFNTPSHHRVHHGSDPIYLDRNYGGMLIVWDRDVRQLPGRAAPSDVRADLSGRDLQRLLVAVRRVRQDLAGRQPGDQCQGQARLCLRAAGVGASAP
ncbi:sterol desaturase family protein [Aeromicrobium sp. UC242_57]|uniref:sterol desaturase family protein n=1 Tax=Aeromicrobium sp. UC242_57 TaxID=3374624 RepID=UPI00378FA3C3